MFPQTANLLHGQGIARRTIKLSTARWTDFTGYYNVQKGGKDSSEKTYLLLCITRVFKEFLLTPSPEKTYSVEALRSTPQH